MFRTILLIVSFACFFNPNLVKGQAVLVEDYFTNNMYKWWVGKSPIAKAEIWNKKYSLSYTGRKSWSSNIKVGINPKTDFIIEAQMKKVTGTDANGYGLTWGKGRRGYYAFVVTPKGKFYIRKVLRDRPGSYLVDWKESEHINQNAANKLMIQKTGDELHFFINDKFVAQLPSQSFFGKQVGFILYQNQQVDVHYFKVHGGSRIERPEEIVTKKIIAEKIVPEEVLPDLKIKQLAINDNEDIENGNSSFGNGNSIIEPGESIEVTAFVQNFGNATAKDVEAKIVLELEDRNISCPDTYKDFKLGDIKPGDYKLLKFFFFTSRRYSLEEIPFKIVLKERNGAVEKIQELGLKMNERTTNIVDVDLSNLNNAQSVKMKEITEVIELADVDKNIPKTNFNGQNTLAVIIGVEDYKYAPEVDFAERDAQVFYKYAQSVFGVPKQNIYFLSNEEATLGEFKKIFSSDGWLARRTEKDVSNVIVYYAGHGAPDVQSKSAYLIPYDIDPNYPKTGFSLDDMYSTLSSLKAKSVTVFLDACFSGKSRTEEMLIAGARSVIIKTKSSAFSAKNMAVISASSKEQYSAADPSKHHGIFTYYLLKSLQVNAHSLNEISVKSFYEQIRTAVSKRAGFLDKEQTPSLIGNDKNRNVILN